MAIVAQNFTQFCETILKLRTHTHCTQNQQINLFVASHPQQWTFPEIHRGGQQLVLIRHVYLQNAFLVTILIAPRANVIAALSGIAWWLVVEGKVVFGKCHRVYGDCRQTVHGNVDLSWAYISENFPQFELSSWLWKRRKVFYFISSIVSGVIFWP